MIPEGGVLPGAVQSLEQPSRTWRLDLEHGRVSGMIDGLEALKQAVFKTLQTERFRYLIYSANYGHELRDLIGSSPLFLASEVKRMLEEAVLQDDRILRIDDVETRTEDDSLRISFTVVSRLGSFQGEMEVI
ncbi:DUF2634 domain-containing protein [Paenibacillus chungangensis]|uniref:DUF2634 domain-containing protein n=1 Tax=Paenibacillus chungangensis TaxID=696535 RepID=A0ABW3HQU6_9BACL